MAERRMTVLNPSGYQETLQNTDNVIISFAPSHGDHAANKAYVDTTVTAAFNDVDLDSCVKINGSTMTGLLFLSADPNQAMGAATKQYVDNSQTTTFWETDAGYLKPKDDNADVSIGGGDIYLNADGTARFASGDIELNANGDVVCNDITANDIASVDITCSSLINSTAGTPTFSISSAGEAVFAGPLEAESIDGGEYAT